MYRVSLAKNRNELRTRSCGTKWNENKRKRNSKRNASNEPISLISYAFSPFIALFSFYFGLHVVRFFSVANLLWENECCNFGAMFVCAIPTTAYINVRPWNFSNAADISSLPSPCISSSPSHFVGCVFFTHFFNCLRLLEFDWAFVLSYSCLCAYICVNVNSC